MIPRIGLKMIVVEGVDAADLEKGPGHYPDTADPWEDPAAWASPGTGPPTSHPFGNLDEMKLGDDITLRTEFGTFRYVVNDVFVVPTEGSGKVLTQTDKPTLVLTTCHPEVLGHRAPDRDGRPGLSTPVPRRAGRRMGRP